MYKDVGYIMCEKRSFDKHNKPRVIYEPKIFYCNELSIGQSEFYQSSSVGLKPEIKLEARLLDLTGITHIKYNDKLYKILRTYKNGDKIEITLTSVIVENK